LSDDDGVPAPYDARAYRAPRPSQNSSASSPSNASSSIAPRAIAARRDAGVDATRRRVDVKSLTNFEAPNGRFAGVTRAAHDDARRRARRETRKKN
jgi:hypothetical protein